MGRRLLTATRLSFHQARVRNPATYAPIDLDGEDLLDIFSKWAGGLSADDTKDDRRQTWVAVEDVQRCARRVLLLTLAVGAYGESGPVVDSESGEEVFQLTDAHAPTGQNRAALFVPEQGESAFYLAEESSRGSAGGRLLGLFKKHYSSYTNAITMDSETVTESETWSQRADLREVEVRVGVGAMTLRTACTSRSGRCHGSRDQNADISSVGQCCRGSAPMLGLPDS